MSLRRRIALSVGITAGAVGVGLALQPGLLGGLSVGEAGVLALGVAALLYALLPLALQHETHRRQAPPFEPGPVYEGEPPGGDLDRLFAKADGSRARSIDDRYRLRRRLETSAVRAVQKRDDCSEAAASEALEAGTWTDDPVAAQYFSDRDGDVAAGLPPGRRVRFHLAAGSPGVRAARRVADEITAMTRTEGRS